MVHEFNGTVVPRTNLSANSTPTDENQTFLGERVHLQLVSRERFRLIYTARSNLNVTNLTRSLHTVDLLAGHLRSPRTTLLTNLTN